MTDLNTVTVEGRLARDPQVHRTDNGTIARFSVASTEHYKSGDEFKERVQWINVGVYDKFAAEKAEKTLHKGSHVLIQGRIESHSYEQNGETKYATEVAVRPGNSLLKCLDVTPKASSAAPAQGLAEAIGPRETQQQLRQHSQ